MKRSPLEYILAYYISGDCSGEGGDVITPEHKRQAKFLLDKVEEAGMLPPMTNWLVENHPEQQIGEDPHDHHLWEPEDETK
jgi:hypothetical protein